MKKILHFLKETWELLKDSLFTWYERDPFRNSTVISYYTIFSLPGLFVIIVNLAGYFYGTEALTNQISTEVDESIGSGAANWVEQIIANAYTSEDSLFTSIISITTLFFAATGVFYQIQQTLNIMWKVEPRPERMVLRYLRDRVFSFGMILAIGFLLLASLVVSSLISALGEWMAANLFGAMSTVLKVVDFTLSLAIITILFGAIFRFLPDAKIRWRDVWPGAFISSLLFVIAKFALSLYFSYSDPGSVYGAAGSVILIMLWTTYSAMVLLYGAEFTQVFARRYGVRIEPADYAVSVDRPKEEADFRSKVKTEEQNRKEQNRKGQETEGQNTEERKK